MLVSGSLEGVRILVTKCGVQVSGISMIRGDCEVSKDRDEASTNQDSNYQPPNYTSLAAYPDP